MSSLFKEEWETVSTCTHTHIHTQPFYGLFSGTDEPVPEENLWTLW